MPSRDLSLGILFTSKIDGTFDRIAKDIKSKFDQVNESMKKVTKSTEESRRGFITYDWSLKNIITDMEKLLAVQARWYGAKFALFAGVQLPIQSFKDVLAYVNQIEEARAGLLRWGATSGQVTSDMKKQIDGLLILMRRATTEFPVTLEDLSKSMQAFAGAGLPYGVLQGMVDGVAKLRVSFKEIDINQWAVATVGAFNTFKDTLTEVNTDAEKMLLIFEKILRAQAVGIARPESFAKVLQYMGPISKMLGGSLDQLLAMSVAMSNLGGNIAAVSRVTSTMLQAMNTDKFKKILDVLQIKIDPKKTLFAQLDVIMEGLSKAVNENSEIVMGWFNVLTKGMGRGEVRELVKLLLTYGTVYKQLTRDIAESAGGLTAASAIMAMPPSQQWIIFLNLLKEVGKAVNEYLGPDLQKATGRLIDFARGVLVAIDPTGTFADKLDKLGSIGRFAYNITASLVNAFKNIWTALKPVVTILEVFLGVILKVTSWLAEHTRLVEILATVIMVRLLVGLGLLIFRFTGLSAILDVTITSFRVLGLSVIPSLAAGFTTLIARINPLTAALFAAASAMSLLNAMKEDYDSELGKFEVKMYGASLKEQEKELNNLKEYVNTYEKFSKFDKFKSEGRPTSTITGKPQTGVEAGYDARALDIVKKKISFLEQQITLKKKEEEFNKKMKKGGGEEPPPSVDKEKYKSYLADLRSAQKAESRARLEQVKNDYATEERLLENSYKNRTISEEEYQEKKKDLRERGRDIFFSELLEEFYEIRNNYAREREELEKVTDPLERKRRLEVSAAREKADMEKIVTERLKFENKQRIDLDDDVTKNRVENINRIIEAMTTEANLNRIVREGEAESLRRQIDAEEELADFKFRRKEVSSRDYYEDQVRRETELFNKKKELLDRELISYYALSQAKMAKAGENVEEQEKIQNDFLEKVQENKNKQIALEEDYANKVRGIHRKLATDLEEIYRTEGLMGTVREGLRRWLEEAKTTAEGIVDIVKGVGDSLSGALSDMLYSMGKGTFNISKESDINKAEDKLKQIELDKQTLANQKEALQNQRDLISSNNSLSESEKRKQQAIIDTQIAAIAAQEAQLDANKQIVESQKRVAEGQTSLLDIFRKFLDELLKMMTQFIAQETVKVFLKYLAQIVGTYFGSSGGSAGGSAGGSVGGGIGGGIGGEYYRIHKGGVMGQDIIPKKYIDMLPRYHSGVGPDERLSVIRKNEGVFTPGQMKALGQRDVNVQINLENKSSQPVTAKQGKTQFDGKKYVISVILEDIRQGGVLRGAIANV